jgi:hypothetical protein
VFDDFSWAVIAALLGHTLDARDGALTLEAAKKGRSPDELLFPLGIPLDLDIESLRYCYAWFLYFGTIEALDVVSYPATFHEVARAAQACNGLEAPEPPSPALDDPCETRHPP